MKRTVLLIGFLAAFLFMGQHEAMAGPKPHHGFSRQYHLVVHQANALRPVPRGKALQVLMNYMNPVDEGWMAYEGDDRLLVADTDNADLSTELRQACGQQLFNCQDQTFRSEDQISQKDLLIWFYRLKEGDNPDYSEGSLPKNYRKAWLAARHANILPEGREVTYDYLSELIYRDHIVQQNHNLPYTKGLTNDLSEIDYKNSHDLREIDEIISDMYSQSVLMRRQKKLLPEEVQYLKRLQDHQEAYQNLKRDLLKDPYILRINPGYYSPVVEHAVRQHGLQQVLTEYRYNYSKNAPYRQHNLTHGIGKMEGVVAMPGEEVSLWKLFSDNNGLDGFKYGWVIINGRDEAWQWGGGICGSATAVFNPVWRAGLEILERKSHSVYYPSLYPIEDIGLDATVYQPRPDMRFRNNFGEPIVFSVVDNPEEKIITLRILGNSPYRRVAITGPVFKNGSKRQVEWVREMEYFDGRTVQETLKSTYNAIH